MDLIHIYWHTTYVVGQLVSSILNQKFVHGRRREMRQLEGYAGKPNLGPTAISKTSSPKILLYML